MSSHGIPQTAAVPLTADESAAEQKKIVAYTTLVDNVLNHRTSATPHTPEALSLTTQLLEQNPEFYTIWNYRRELLQALGLPSDLPTTLKSELAFLFPLMRSFPKAYALWNQRLWLLQLASIKLPVAVAAKFWRKELDLVGMLLAADARNFHGWHYRRLVVAELSRLEGRVLHAEEWAYTDVVLRSGGGLRNYSAWWRRGELMTHVASPGQDRIDLLEDELENIVKKAIVTDVEDQSLWLHYQWLVTSNCASGDETATAPGMEWEIRAGFLGAEIEWLEERLEDHPVSQCKYILLALITFVMLRQKVRREPHTEEEEVEEEVDEEKERKNLRGWVQTLKQADPMRKGRYDDLERKILVLE